ncbi:MAG: hypothetical protein IJM66_03385 [Muribaculaceae bacterium]|nr:hypothetical protein [Muribaculaceae bacterium]
MITVAEKTLIEQRFGREIRYPADVEALHYDVLEATGESISVNTLKRLLGMVTDVKQARQFTLDTIARYVGHDTWEAMTQFAKEKGNSDFEDVESVVVASLCEGDMIELTYPPDRMVRMRHTRGDECVVIESVNGKLREGDVVDVSHLVLGYPLYAKEVTRDGMSMGSFTAGKTGGLSSIRIINDKDVKK